MEDKKCHDKHHGHDDHKSHDKSECHKKIAGFLKKAAELHEKAAHEHDCGKAAVLSLEAFAFICEAKCHFKKMVKKCAGIECCHEKKA